MKKLLPLFVLIIVYSSVNYLCIAQFEEFTAGYDTLSTIAGKGLIGDKGVNGWLEGYEGGLQIIG